MCHTRFLQCDPAFIVLRCAGRFGMLRQDCRRLAGNSVDPSASDEIAKL